MIRGGGGFMNEKYNPFTFYKNAFYCPTKGLLSKSHVRLTDWDDEKAVAWTVTLYEDAAEEEELPSD